MHAATRRLESRRNYEAGLELLAGRVGERNRNLLQLARLGLLAGRSAEQVHDDIMANCGTPRLGEAEVRRACARATTCVRQDAAPPAASRAFARRTRLRRSGPTEREQSFVRTMITAGGGTATPRDLAAISPEPIASLPNAQAAQFLRTAMPDFRFRTLAGPCTIPRTFDNLVFPDVLYRRLVDGAPVPEFVQINQYTGLPFTRPDGSTSYAVTETLATRRLMLVEFDALALGEQAAFWLGVILRRLLPVRTLVYSGGKSIHALVRMREVFSPPRNTTPDPRAWNEQWAKLERLVCSDPDTAYRADPACKSACHFTRMPGHRRSETGRLQQLLWCSGVQPADAPAGFAIGYGRDGRWYGDGSEVIR